MPIQTRPTRIKRAKRKNGHSPVPKILPREPLTKKAFAAISAYANHKADTQMQGYKMAHFMVKWTLEAERMRRATLYAWLEERGFKWRPEHGSWDKPEEKVTQ